MKKRILIGPSSFAETDSEPLDKLIANEFEVIKNPFRRKLTTEELTKLLRGVEGLIAGLETLNREVLEHSELKVISRCGSGMSNVDVDAAKELGIKVVSTPDAPVNSVAELTVGMMIELIRYVYQMNVDLHNGRWTKKIGNELECRTVAIIGFGRIGRRVAELLRSFHSRIIAVDPNCSGMVDEVPIVSLQKALSQADIITIHASTEDMILGEKEFASMKRGIFLLNCARGSIINESQLLHALKDGHVAGAWLDCFAEEPYKGPLIHYPQVILTPHIGTYTVECRRQMEMESVDNLIMAFRELG